MYEIEDNIPLPKSRSNATAKYPWKQLKVGQSFVVSTEDVDRASISAQASLAARKLGVKFVTRHDKEAGIVRVWRVI